jgi:ATPase complex subunit ATP10
MRQTLRLLQTTQSASKRTIAPLRLDSSFVPKPLGAPIGFQRAPRPVDDHSQQQRRDTLIERNLAEREKLTKAYVKSYFRDFRNLDHHNGKFYLGNAKLYKKEAALYFPNLSGRTLVGDGATDTTRVLRGKVSVVTILSRNWAAEQVQSFVGETQNPELRTIIEESGGVAQHVTVNFEEGRLFAAMLWIFERNLRRTTPKKEWERYFIMSGLPTEVKETLGIMNEKIGYVFLLDSQCKIRWSACADANEEEKDHLNRGLRRLIEERKAMAKTT